LFAQEIEMDFSSKKLMEFYSLCIMGKEKESANV